MATASGGSDRGLARARVHLGTGWCLLALFVALGMALEAMHAFKLGWFLDLSNETRRLLLRLAHAHGVLLGLVNVAFALSIPHRTRLGERAETWISRCILAGSALLPSGFLLGGLVVMEGDPNPAILLAALGAPLLLAGALGVAWSFLAKGPPPDAGGSQRLR